MKRISIYFVTPLMAISLVVLKTFESNKWVKENIPDASNYIVFLLVVATVYNYIANFYAPEKQLSKFKKRRWGYLNKAAKSIFGEYSNLGLSINIMVPKTQYLRKIEPKKPGSEDLKVTMKVKVFSVIWENGRDGVSDQFKLTENQGLCGKVFKKKTITSVPNIEFISTSFPPGDINDFNLSKAQLDATSGIVTLISCPLVIQEEGEGGVKRSTVGVLNVESRDAKADKFMTDTGKRQKLFTKIVDFAELYNALHI
jgi:hypothetical protein